MSGIVGSKLNIRGSGRIAKLGTDGQVLTSSGAGVAAAFEDLAAGISWQTIETGSTLTAVAGNGYPIDTTSNACTITLPASASVGDEIIFTDYDRTWGTNEIEIDSNGLNYQGAADTYTVKYNTDGQSVHIIYMDATNGWIPISNDDVTYTPSLTKGIFGYGTTGSNVDETNLVSDTGVIATDVTGVGTDRQRLAACEYGGDKGIFGFGDTGSKTAVTNLVSNAGVVATDQAAVTGTIRGQLAACGYGGDKGIFSFGTTPMTNLVSNAGVIASDVAQVGTGRDDLAACEYGGDKGIFGFGGGGVSRTNLVSNAGVVASDQAATTGTARSIPAACSFGSDEGIFGFGHDGSYTDATNLVSNTGVVAEDVTGVGTARGKLAATQYGADKGIFGFGDTGSATNVSNLVSNVGVVASDQAATTGTARYYLAACSYGP